jgi:release factor glutamine methyltransferase
MLVSDALRLGNVDSADRGVLLGATLGTSRTWLLAHPEHALSADEEKLFCQWIAQREAHEPVAYLTGRKEFFGREFEVTPATLIPRPATERLVEIAADLLRNGSKPGFVVHTIDSEIVAAVWVKHDPKHVPLVVDIGTGSGCIAVTLACEIPALHVIATDVSADALQVAKRNAQGHDVLDRIEFREGSLLEPLLAVQEPFFLVSNPPYIPAHTELMPDVLEYEPHQALFGGLQGADVVHALMKEAKANPHCMGYAIECRVEQANMAFDPPRSSDTR